MTFALNLLNLHNKETILKNTPLSSGGQDDCVERSGCILTTLVKVTRSVKRIEIKRV
jgi:hypothetical protein